MSAEPTITIGRCKACKWCTPDPFSSQDLICSNENICEWAHRKPERTDQLAYIYDESGAFCPGPDFGCVHWEPRE